MIASNGYLYSFGKENSEGQLGHGDTNPRNVPALIESLTTLGEKMVSISCGFKHTICKSSLGKVFTWGAGDFGQLGHGQFSNELLPKIIKPDRYSDQKHSVNKVLQVKAGFRSCIVLVDNRKVYWWGTNSVLERERNPRFMDYGVFLELGEGEKASDYLPIRLLSSWNKTCSVMYMTMADCTRVSSHLPVIQKCCNNLSSKWEAQTSRIVFFSVMLD